MTNPVTHSLRCIVMCMPTAQRNSRAGMVLWPCRLALHRPGNGPLAQGNDTVTLQTRVKLLDGQDGQYMIGSVHFSKPGDAARSATDTDTDAIGSTLLPSASSLPALSNVMASARGQALLDSQVTQSLHASSPAACCSTWCIHLLTCKHAGDIV